MNMKKKDMITFILTYHQYHLRYEEEEEEKKKLISSYE